MQSSICLLQGNIWNKISCFKVFRVTDELIKQQAVVNPIHITLTYVMRKDCWRQKLTMLSFFYGASFPILTRLLFFPCLRQHRLQQKTLPWHHLKGAEDVSGMKVTLSLKCNYRMRIDSNNLTKKQPDWHKPASQSANTTVLLNLPNHLWLQEYK